MEKLKIGGFVAVTLVLVGLVLFPTVSGFSAEFIGCEGCGSCPQGEWSEKHQTWLCPRKSFDECPSPCEEWAEECACMVMIGYPQDRQRPMREAQEAHERRQRQHTVE